MAIEIAGITKRFGSFTALDDVDLTVEQGELLALLGPSGSGKTTLLRIVAGLEFADAGDIRMYGETTQGRAPRDRQVGFVFQHYALFRHMTVFENIAFGLRVRPRPERKSNAAIAARVHELLRMMQLDWLADRYPWQLSGGQRQRVALARAMAVKPKVLLLDEPFGALDAKVRKELRRWLRRLHEEVHVTSVFVTHDQEEALEVSDRVVIMNEGKVEQSGTPEEVYDRPATPFVYGFLGDVNLFHGRIHQGHVNIGESELEAPEWAHASDQAGVAYVRTYDVELEAFASGPSSLEAVVRHIRAFGPMVRLELDLVDGGRTIEAHIPRARFESLGLGRGERVFVSPTSVRVFAQPT